MSEEQRHEPPPAAIDDDAITVHVGGGDGVPEQLLRISRPVDGVVRVREWSGSDWSSAHEREMSAEALVRALEEAARQRRRLGEELYRIRLWLTGAGG